MSEFLQSVPTVTELPVIVETLRAWTHDGNTVPLHPGDIGWFWRFGAPDTAAALRTWGAESLIIAVGFFDGPDVLRVAVSPAHTTNRELARAMRTDFGDFGDFGAGTLPASVSVEARAFPALRADLVAHGWIDDEPWSPLRRDLSTPVEPPELRIDVTTATTAYVRTAIQRSAFDGSTFTDEKWRAMAAGPAYVDARCIVGYDDAGAAVAAVTVWSAGDGRPGLLEPVGVHRDHRGHGHGTAIALAAAAALRDMGSSSALVCTPSANAAAVATYVSAGFTRLAESRDLRLPTMSPPVP